MDGERYTVHGSYSVVNTVNPEIFASFIFAKSIKRHICDAKNP